MSHESRLPSIMSALSAIPRPVETYHTQTYARLAPAQSGFKGQGKTVVVTGGATGIGYSISQSFAATGISRLVLISRSAGPQQEAKKSLEATYPGLSVIGYQVSVTDATRIGEIFHELGSIDVLVLSAFAADSPTKSQGSEADALAASVADLQGVFETNVVAAYSIIQAYQNMPAPKSGGVKTLINVTSVAAHVFLGMPGITAYSTSKAAISKLVQHLALSQSPEKAPVTMISFHPGAHYTPSASKVMGKDAFEWDDIDLPGHFAVWLASPEATFLHSKMVWAHWDVDELIAQKERILGQPDLLTLSLKV